MVVHKETHAPREPHYAVAAKLCEPDYKAEFKYLRAELAFVERKIREHRPGHNRWLSKLGILQHDDWHKYHQALGHYSAQLRKYSEEVIAGVLPVKFAVYNASAHPDQKIAVRVHVEHGRVDERRKPPVRPERIDRKTGSSLKLSLQLPSGFARTGIKITAHEVKADFSTLDSHDGATLINQIVHVHCGPDTQVFYEIRSKNVVRESGEVDL